MAGRLAGITVAANRADNVTANVNYEGMTFKLRYQSRASMRLLGERCMTWKFDRKSGSRSPDVDYAKLAQELSKSIVEGWEGVTPRKLAKYIPIDGTKFTSPAQWDEEIPYSVEDLMVLLQNCPTLETMLQDCATDASLFFPPSPTLEGELGNSKPTPNGSSTPAS